MSKKFVNNELLLTLCNNYLEHTYPTNAQYEEVTNQIIELMQKAKTRLANNHDVLDMFDKLEDLFFCAEAETSDLYFCDGFRLGMLLALEILGFTPTKN